MYSNKQRTVLSLLLVFSGLLLSVSVFLVLLRTERLGISVIDSDVAETTMTDYTIIETTTFETATSDQSEESVFQESSASEEGPDELPTEATLPLPSDEPEASETAVSEEIAASQVSEESWIYVREYTKYSIFDGGVTDSLLLLVVLFLTAASCTLFLVLFPAKKPFLGPDGALVLFTLCVTALMFFPYPSQLSVRMDGHMPGRGFYDGYRMLYLFYFLRFLIYALLYAGIILSLREFLCFLRAKGRGSWIFLERITSDPVKEAAHPNRRIILSVLSLMLLTCLTAVSVLLVFGLYDSRLRYLFICLICLSLSFLGLLFCALHALVRGLREVRTVREELIEEAVKSERLRVDLIANVSHDLRTPLTSILGYGNLLQEEELSESGRENLNLLNQKADYMKDLVDSVFELTKVSSGVLVSEKAPLDLIRLLEQTLAVFQDDFQHAGLTVRRHYCSDSLTILSDGAFLNRVIANLLQNAVKYALENTRVHITVSEEADKKARIRIANISRSELDFDPSEITERFTRGDRSRSTKGSGLGLAIAKTYTEAVGGTFRVEIDGDVFGAVIEGLEIL